MELLHCSACSGDTGLEHPKKCPSCHGEHFLLTEGKQVFYWGTPIAEENILSRRIARVGERAFLVVLFLFGIFGVLALWWLLTTAKVSVFAFGFWTAPQSSLLFFSVTLWTDAYLASRMLRAREKQEDVVRKVYSEDADHVVSLGFDQAIRIPKAKWKDISRTFTPQALDSIEQAYTLAVTGGFGQVCNAHVLAMLLKTQDVSYLFARLNIDPSVVVPKLRDRIASLPPRTQDTVLADELWRTLFSAYQIAQQTRAVHVRPLELFLAVVSDPHLKELLEDLGADEKKIKNVTTWVRVVTDMRDQNRKRSRMAASRPKGGMNRSMTAIATPMLDSMSEDLTLRAVYGNLPPFVGREEALSSLFRVLEGGGRSLVLVGETGTGKHALLEGLATAMVQEDVPPTLQDKRLVVLSVPKIIAGATVADAAARLERVFYEIAVSGNIILAIPNIEGLVGVSTGSSGGVDLADIVESNVSKMHLLTIATTTPENYTTLVERSSLGRSFEKLDFPEPDADAAIQICEAKSGSIEAQSRVWFSYDAIEKAVTLSTRFLHDRFLPEKAIEVLKEVAYAVKKKKGEHTIVSGEDVAVLISEKAHVPASAVTQTERDTLLNLEERMHGRVIGQEEAVQAVAKAIRRARTELRAENRPIANFLFLGPTGVGKTELAKTVAESYFGNEKTMSRLDMSEYQDPSAIHRLLGVPGGSVGGLLTEMIRKTPHTLLLLDEIEKAHPDLLNVFLQVMDDGRLTDNLGRTIDFTEVILIATSNAGSDFIQQSLSSGKTIDEIHNALINEKLQGIFRPEFLNRFDGVIVFRPLTKEDLYAITRLMLIGIAKQLEPKQILLQATDEAVRELGDAGYDPAFGARPLRRLLQDRIQDALAEGMLSGKIGKKDTVILEKGGSIRVEHAGG